MDNWIFKDFGPPVNSQETRSSVISRDDFGNLYLVIFTRGSLLNIDLKNEKYTQVFFPEKNDGYPFISLCSTSGKVYTGSDNMFLEFDPVQNKFTYFEYLKNVHVCAFGLDEDKSGNIMFGSYSDSGSRLFSYDPKVKKIKDFGPMDKYAMYTDHVACDNYGWVYMSMGTEKRNIVGFNPITGERKQYINDELRQRGSAYVQRDSKGVVCGHFDSDDVGYGFVKEDLNPDKKWYKFENGEAESISHTLVEPSFYYHNKHAFETIHSPFYDADKIFEHQISDNFVRYAHPDTGEIIKLKLQYITEGANLSPMVKGSDCRIYGTSNHPMHGYCFDPDIEKIVNYGGDFYEDAGGGNVCAYAVIDNIIGGAAYYGGKVHILDTTKPFKPGLNPKLVARQKEILRPRSAVANKTVNCLVFGGFGENGSDGGGLYFYDLDRSEGYVLKNHEIIRYHNTMCMVIDKSGNLIGGTSTFAPCGGIPKVNEAKIYVMDWNTKKVIKEYIPVEGAVEISLMKMDEKNLLHGFTSDSKYFVFDLDIGETVYIKDLSSFGRVVRDGLVKGDNDMLYAVMSNTVFSINTSSHEQKVIGSPQFPITSGIAFDKKGIYFGCGPRLCGFVK